MYYVKQVREQFENDIYSFSDEYKNIPGILHIDYSQNNSIIAFIDNKKLKTKIIGTYNGYKVFLYDVRKTLNKSKLLMKKFQKEKIDLNDEKNFNLFCFINDIILICNKMLKLHKK